MGSPRLRLRVLTALALLAAAGVGRASEAWPVARGPSHEPNPYRYDPAQWQAVPKDFLEDTSACILYSGTTYLVEDDGTVENVTHEITRLNGRKGVEKLGEYRHIAYDPSYQKLVLNEAVLHKGDGRRLDVEPRHVQLRDVSTDYQVYDREKQLIISFPNLEVGDTLEVKWTLRGKNPEHGGHFFTRYDFGDPGYPVGLDELRVRVPAGRPFKYASSGGRLEPTVTESGGQRLYDWKARQTRQLPQDDNLPSKEELRPSVACSTFPSWEEVGRWKQRLRADAWACPPEVRRVVAEVTRGLDDPAARARALTLWVRRNIRYVSSGERHDYTPHLPARVFANRFGDCKDTSQFLAVMLREAGLAVALSTLGALDDGQVNAAVPSPWGTHAILLVSLPDGEHWVDTTLSLGAWDFLPREDRDRACYLVDPDGRLTLRRTPPMTPADNRFEQTTDLRVGPDGTSHCERTVTAYGSAALAQRDGFSEVPAGERRRQVAAELQEANSKARLLRLAVDEDSLRDVDRPVTSRMAFDVPGHFTGNPDREGSVSDSRTWTRLLSYNVDYDRQPPLEIPAPFESRHRYRIHLPAAYALDGVPGGRTIASPWGRFEVRVTEPAGDGPVRDLEVTFLTRLEKTRVRPEQFDEYRRFQEEVARSYRVWLTLKAASDPADLPVLEGVLALVPDDSASAAALARLYRGLGKAEDARRVLRRARHYRPDDGTLWELSVQCAADPDEEEEAQRELARRFPEEPRHALALGTLLVRRGKHAEAGAALEPLAEDGAPPEQAQAHLLLARSYYQAGKPVEALAHLEAAEEADAEGAATAAAAELRGRVCEDLGRSGDAAAAYRQALAAGDGTPEPLGGLVRLSVAANERDQALDYLRQYAVRVGDDPDGLLLAADYYARLGRYDDALDLANKAARKRPDARAERTLGLVRVRRGEYSLALAHLEKASPDAAVLEGTLRALLAVGAPGGLAERVARARALKDAPPELGRACAAAEVVLQRRHVLEQVAPAPPGRADWGRALDCVACAEHARAGGRPAAEVERLLIGAFAGGSAPGPALALRGRLALDSGKLARATADAEQAVALSPLDAAGYFVRGRVRLERGQAGALDDLQKAAELTGGKDADVLHALADALFRDGKSDKALALQRDAVRLKPQDREMLDQLSVFEKAARPAGTGG